MLSTHANSESRWPHRWAMLLACVTFPLIWVGGLVTTTHSGMAVPDWPNTYGYNLFLYPWTTWIYGPWSIFVEHGHRLLGSLAGMVTIALAASIWWSDQRRWLRVLAIVALVAVIGQGILGGMRVLLDARTLAMIHGCTGPAFFALAVALAVFTSRVWRRGSIAVEHPHAGRLQRLAVLTAALAYLQLVLGAQLRHFPVTGSPGALRGLVLFHLLMAGALVVHALLLARVAVSNFKDRRALWLPAASVAALVCGQIVLGCATWVLKYSWPAWIGENSWSESYTVAASSTLQTLVVTAHVATGSLIVVTALTSALFAVRLVRPEPRRLEFAAPALKGAT